MSTYDQHMAKFGEYKKLIASLETLDDYAVFSEEQVILHFQAAIHRIEAMFFRTKPVLVGKAGTRVTVEHSKSHQERSAVIGRCFEKMQSAYTTLHSYNALAAHRRYISDRPNGRDPKRLLQDIERNCEEFELKSK